MINIFVSYAHADREMKDELEKHLIIMQRNGLILPWTDSMIVPGEPWDKSISVSMNNADLIICLISPDFLSSQYCYEIEMKTAMERHNEKKTLVIPVILRYCEWMTTPFSTLQALPTLGKPIKDWQDQDHAFYDVVEGLKKTISSLVNPNTATDIGALQNTVNSVDAEATTRSNGEINSGSPPNPQTSVQNQPPAAPRKTNIFVLGSIAAVIVATVAVTLLWSRSSHRRWHQQAGGINSSLPSVVYNTSNNVAANGNLSQFKAARLSNVTFKRGDIEGSFVFRGTASWMQFYNGHKMALHELKRDDWSVFLRDSASSAIFQLDLSHMNIYFAPDGVAMAQYATITAAYPLEQK